MPEGDRYQAEIENQKITAAWNAMRSVSNDPFSVTWGDFMLTQQVMQLWCSQGRLIEDLKKNDQMKKLLMQIAV